MKRGTPVRNLQRMLLYISKNNSNIRRVNPDGIFGTDTKNAVMDFQKYKKEEVTGEADLYTYNEIVKEYEIIKESKTPPLKIPITNNPYINIKKGETDDLIYIIKGMLKIIDKKFENEFDVEMNNKFDDNLLFVLKKIEKIAEIRMDNCINKEILNVILNLYNIYCD